MRWPCKTLPTTGNSPIPTAMFASPPSIASSAAGPVSYFLKVTSRPFSPKKPWSSAIQTSAVGSKGEYDTVNGSTVSEQADKDEAICHAEQQGDNEAAKRAQAHSSGHVSCSHRARGAGPTWRTCENNLSRVHVSVEHLRLRTQKEPAFWHFLPVTHSLITRLPAGRATLRLKSAPLVWKEQRDGSHGAPLQLMLNASRCELAETGLVDRLIAVFEDTGIAPGRLVIEIPGHVLTR